MCGIINLVLLLQTIASKRSVYDGDISIDDPMFMYVKNYCGYSKRAAKHLLPLKNITMLDRVKNEFVHYNKDTNRFKGYCKKVPSKLKDAFIFGDTVPQIFIYKYGKWMYIGGSQDVLKLKVNATSGLLLDSKTANPIPNLKW